eukprot:sb/3471777/
MAPLGLQPSKSLGVLGQGRQPRSKSPQAGSRGKGFQAPVGVVGDEIEKTEVKKLVFSFFAWHMLQALVALANAASPNNNIIYNGIRQRFSTSGAHINKKNKVKRSSGAKVISIAVFSTAKLFSTFLSSAQTSARLSFQSPRCGAARMRGLQRIPTAPSNFFAFGDFKISGENVKICKL